METMISLMMIIIAFMSVVVLVAYVADAAACKFVEWMRLEDFAYEH